MTDPLESLKAVLCDPEGRVCIDGSDGDRKVIQDALAALSQQAEPVAWRSEDWKLIVRTEYQPMWPSANIPLYAAPLAVQQAEPENIYQRAARRLKDGKPGISGTLDDKGNFIPAVQQAEPTRSQKLAEAGFARRPTTLEIQLKGDGDDEAVRLLREAREWLGNGLTVAKIDAYLAKGKK